MIITVGILVAALFILLWGFQRARTYGKLGILAWLQSVLVTVPWLIFFGLASFGIALNFAAILILIVSSASLYIALGQHIRNESKRVSDSNKTITSEFRGDYPETTSVQTNYQSESLHKTDKQQVEKQSYKTDSTHSNSYESEVNNIKDDESVSPEEVGDRSSSSSEDVNVSLNLSTIPPEDLQRIKEIFSIDTFFSTESVPYQDGAIFKGNLRGEAQDVYEKLSSTLVSKVGDRYRLYALIGAEDKPVMLVLPSTSDPKPATRFQWVVSFVLAIATVATCLESASLINGFDLSQNFGRFQDTLMVGGGILSILLFRELGHWTSAKKYNIRLSPPFFIPSWQIGSLGSLIRIQSVLPNRNALFDIAIAGPLFGGALSLVFLIMGLSLSHQGSYFQIPTSFFQGSILVGALARVFLNGQIQQSIVDVHPLTVVGWLGLVITALNTMPAGQLDGGRVVQSIYGRKIAQRTTIATLIVLGIVTFVNPLAFYWAIVIFVLQRDLDRPSLNELTEPDDARAVIGLLALFAMATILLPLTSELAGRLGIGA